MYWMKTAVIKCGWNRNHALDENNSHELDENYGYRIYEQHLVRKCLVRLAGNPSLSKNPFYFTSLLLLANILPYLLIFWYLKHHCACMVHFCNCKDRKISSF